VTPRAISVDALIAARRGAAPPVVLDVRERAEVQRARIPGAVHLARRRLEFRVAQRVPDRATPLVLVDGGEAHASGCADARAALSAATLQRLGYADVAHLDGGVAGWRRAGLPVLCGIEVSSRAFEQQLGGGDEVRTVDVDTLLRWRRDGTVVALCDVRSPEEHAAGTLPGAVCVPDFRIAVQAVDIAAEADVLVLVSSGRTRSGVFARVLARLGLGDVAVLDGGVLAWRLAGQPLETGSRRTRGAPSLASRHFGELGAARLAKRAGVRELGAGELAALLEGPPRNRYVFDLRPYADVEAGRIPGAVPLAPAAAVLRSEDAIAVPGAPVVLAAGEPLVVRLAAAWLRGLGHADVAMLAGGLAAWMDAGRPLACGREPALGEADARAAAPAIQAREAAAWIASATPPRVLHVDSLASFRAGHLPGSTWLQRGWLEPRIPGLVPDRATPLLVTCTDGAQAAFATATLAALGYARACRLDGGVRAWAAQDRPLATPDPAAHADEDDLPLPADRDEQGMRDYLDWAGRVTRQG
jgi:rhodanese-related sulfurtransferase